MQNVTIKDIVSVTGGRLLCGDENKEIREFAIDSRQGNEDSIFVPIIGERVDAHRFIEGALKLNGAVFTMEHDAPLPGYENKPWIRVEDTVKAMQQVGTFYREKMSMPVVAVTGSVGKTTTREMIAYALSADRQVFQTMGNQNSQIGVPLTLSHMSPEDDVAVLEIGMSERGQIESLTTMIRPDVAVVTVIGVSHIAQLGSQENICAEKMDIVKGLPDDGLVFLNGDDPFLAAYKDKLDKKVFYYGMSPNCQYRAENIQTRGGRTSFDFCYIEEEDADSTAKEKGESAGSGMKTKKDHEAIVLKENKGSRKNVLKKMNVTLGTMGDHNVRNALAALGICHQMGASLTAAAEKLAGFHGQRQQVIKTSRCTLIDDTYNASPDSMKAAIKVLADMEAGSRISAGGRRIAGLADMLELGENERQYHYEVGAFIAGQPIDEVAVYGDLSGEIIRGIEDNGAKIKCSHFATRKELEDYLLETIKPEDILLLKGSNGMKLKEIAEAIKKLH